MASDSYGYRRGPRELVRYELVSTTAALVEGDMVKISGTAPYITACAAGDANFLGFAAEGASSPSSNGDTSILVDVSYQSVYAYPPDAGSIAIAQRGLTVDIGGTRSVDIDGSGEDVLMIKDVDVAANLVFVSKHYVPGTAEAGVA